MSLVLQNRESERLQRGFKTWAENTSLTIRSRLGLVDKDPLAPRTLAEHMKVRVWTPQDVSGISPAALRHLLSADGNEWSALSMHVASVDVVVINPTHSPARQASDIMHELSHIIRGHEPAQVHYSSEAGVGIRTFKAVQEAEADWLAGCLLLPRPALAFCASRRLSKYQACEEYGVSVDLYTYRLNITGVMRQFSRRPSRA
jgi:hypothetical protein